MKTKLPLILLFALPSYVWAQTTENLITNGDFEAAPKEAVSYAFNECPGWYNRAERGTRQDAQARRNDENKGDSTYNATINNKEPASSIFFQKTDHKIQAGEVYRLSMDWRQSFQWRAADTVKVTVFATLNDKLSGAVVWEDTVDFSNSSGEAWATVTHDFQAAHPDAEGKLLMFSFQGVGSQEMTDKKRVGFARVDNIVLEVAKP